MSAIIKVIIALLPAVLLAGCMKINISVGTGADGSAFLPGPPPPSCLVDINTDKCKVPKTPNGCKCRHHNG